MKYLYSFVGIYMDVLLLLFLTIKFEKKKGNAFNCFTFILYGLFVFGENIMNLPIFIKLPLNICFVFLSTLSYINIDFLNKIKFIVIHYILLAIPELLITTIVFYMANYTIDELYENTYLWFVCLILSKTVTFFLIMVVTKVKRLNSEKRRGISINHLFGFMPLLIALVFLIYDMYIIINIEILKKNTLLIIIVTITIILIAYTFSHMILFDVYDEFKEKQAEVKILESKNLFQYDFYKQKMASETEVRKIYHDLKNEMILLKKYENPKKYIESLLDSLSKLENFIDTGNEMFDIMIYEKMKITEKNNIDFKVLADFNECDFLSDLEICTLFGNLLDNAIEASCRILEKKDRYIILKCKTIDDKFIIKIVNSYDKKMVRTFGNSFITIKQNKKMHGIGLNSVKSIVNLHQGSISIIQKDNEFQVSIIFYLGKT